MDGADVAGSDDEDDGVQVRVDAKRFKILQAAYNAGRLKVHVDYRPHLRNHSPVYNPWEHLVPLLFLILVSLAILIFEGVLAGTIALVMTAAVYVALIRPFVADRVRTRATALCMYNRRNFNILWDMGGVAITMADRPDLGCTAPADWRIFVRDHVPDVEGRAEAALDGNNPLSPERAEKRRPKPAPAKNQPGAAPAPAPAPDRK